MKVKRVFVFGTGVAVGYVAGAAAGRHRYEQIVHGAQRVASETGLVSAKDRLGRRTGDIARTAAEEAAQASRGVVENATDTVDRGLAAAQSAIGSNGTAS
jgi:hypothetical protein